MLDLNKPMQTRAGQAVKFLHELNTTQRDCLVFAIQAPNQDEELITVGKDGSFFDPDDGESEFDVMNVPEKRYVWLNVHGEPDDFHVSLYYTKDVAKYEAKHCKSFVKTIKVEI